MSAPTRPPLTALADTRTTLPIVAKRALDRLLARCLAKSSDDRWQSAADLAAELRWIREERLRPATEPASGAVSTEMAIARGSRTHERIWMGVAGVAMVALAFVVYWWYSRPAPPQEPVAFTIGAPEGLTVSDAPGLMALSPDGRRLAFATGQGDETQLWVRALGSLAPARVERADGAWQPVWSPDGRAIAFLENRLSSPLRRIDLAGGPPTMLAPNATGRVAWSRSGVILFMSGTKLYRVPDTGGQPSLAMDLDASGQESELQWPAFLPDGRRYLFVARGRDASRSAIFLASLDSPDRTFLLNAHSNVDYAAGYLFYHRDGTLMAHPFDAEAGRLTGDALAVVDGIRYNAANGRGAFSVSESGALSYVLSSTLFDPSRRTLVITDRSGKTLRQIGSPAPYLAAHLSPDGRQAIASVESRSVRSLLLIDIERDLSTRFTVGEVDEQSPVWSPDGSTVVFSSLFRGAETGIYRRSSGGGATRDELLFRPDDPTEGITPTSLSSDGGRLLFTRSGPRESRIWMLPLTGDRTPVEAFPGSTGSQRFPVFSPDGKWIAYAEGPAVLGGLRARCTSSLIRPTDAAFAFRRRAAATRDGPSMGAASSTARSMARSCRSTSPRTATRFGHQRQCCCSRSLDYQGC